MFLDARDPDNQRTENHSVYRSILDALGHDLMMELSLLCDCICGSDFECHFITDLYAGRWIQLFRLLCSPESIPLTLRGLDVEMMAHMKQCWVLPRYT